MSSSTRMRTRFTLLLTAALCVFLLACTLLTRLPSRLSIKVTRRVPLGNALVVGSDFFSREGVRIMPLGDSITDGVNSPYQGGYRVWLWQESEAAGWHVHFVGSLSNGPSTLKERNHEGHSGWRIDQISAHVVPWLRRYQPQLILLHIGTNDILQGYGPVVAQQRLHLLLDQITTTLPDTIVIVAQVTPLGHAALDAQIMQYNQSIPTLVKNEQAQGRHVEYVDMHNVVPVRDVTDSIHPNNDGYMRMAHVWYNALAKLMR